jgi:hypothetical protein
MSGGGGGARHISVLTRITVSSESFVLQTDFQ